MTLLYRRHGGVPALLPTIAYDEENNAYSPPQSDVDLQRLGFVLAPVRPDDTATQTVEWDEKTEAWVLIDRPLPPAPPVLEPQPLVLGKLQFMVLCESAGGMTDKLLVDAQKDPAFEAFWIKYQMASAVTRDDPITRGALEALAAGGYLPNGKAAVLAAWPMDTDVVA